MEKPLFGKTHLLCVKKKGNHWRRGRTGLTCRKRSDNVSRCQRSQARRQMEAGGGGGWSKRKTTVVATRCLWGHSPSHDLHASEWHTGQGYRGLGRKRKALWRKDCRTCIDIFIHSLTNKFQSWSVAPSLNTASLSFNMSSSHQHHLELPWIIS